MTTANHTPAGPDAETVAAAIANADVLLLNAALKPYSTLAEEHAELLATLLFVNSRLLMCMHSDSRADQQAYAQACALVAKINGDAT